jgi:hypothetical protein
MFDELGATQRHGGSDVEESYGVWGGIILTMGIGIWNAIRKDGFNKGVSSARVQQFIELQKATAKHFEDCDKRHEENARMSVKVDVLERNQERMERTVNNIDNKLDRLIERT